MSKEFIYIDYDEALNIYGKMIDASDGLVNAYFAAFAD